MIKGQAFDSEILALFYFKQRKVEQDMNERFFNELSYRLVQEGIDAGPLQNDTLPLRQDGQEVGVLTDGGMARIYKEHLDTPGVSDLCFQAGDIAMEVWTYINQMEQAPPLKAMSLKDPYKLLAEFNGYVLGGMESKYGVQFTTWARTHGNTGLTYGNYFGNDYAAAKQDFAVRSGLVSKYRILSDEQLTEVYRCVKDFLEEDMTQTAAQEDRLKGIQEQVGLAIPDVEERLCESQQHGDMTMR